MKRVRRVPDWLASGVILLLAALPLRGEGPLANPVGTEPFLSIRREQHVVLLEGCVHAASTRRRWHEVANNAEAGQIVDHVRVLNGEGSDPSWMELAAREMGPWLHLVEEGEMRWGNGSVQATGRARSHPDLAIWKDRLSKGLPEGWTLQATLKAPLPGDQIALTVSWENGVMLCRGALPQEAWSIRKATWTGDPKTRVILRDQVIGGAGEVPHWLEALPNFVLQFQEAVQEGTVEISEGGIVLRGRVTSLAAKLRCGREARSLGEESLVVRNYLSVDPVSRASEPLIAAAVAPAPMVAPAPVPIPTMASVAVAPEPEPIKPDPPAVPVRVASGQKKPAQPMTAGMIAISVDPTGVRLDGDLPDQGVKSSLVGTCDAVTGARKVADATKVSPSIKTESWYGALPACLLAVSEHLAQGEFRIGEGRATLQGVAKTGAGRDRLLAAIARALPNEVRFEDRTTVPTEPAEDLFSRNIYFNTGSSYIKPEHREHLREAVAALKASGVDVTLLIKGHADSRGDPQINESLSRERAKAVYDLLARQGVDPKQMEFVGVGAAEAESANGEYAWKQERRVELTVVK